MNNEDIIKQLAIAKLIARKSITDMAEELVNVQPMPNNIMQQLFEVAEDSSKLQEQGYKPVSNLGLLWILREDKSE